MSPTTTKVVTESRKTQETSRLLGAILVQEGRLTPANAEEILRFAEERGLRFGDAAVRLNLLTQSDIDLAIGLQFNYPVLKMGGQHGVAPDVISAYNPQSEFVEPLRTIRSLIALRWRKDAVPMMVAITSPSRREGRSWLAANLAVLFAQTGQRTLLIDTDMRHPRQHQLFNLRNDAGLSALVTGRAGREAAIRIHPQLRLLVVPAGVPPPNPQELLARPVFELVLKQFADQFDVVLLDTPAMCDSADAQILAARAGSAVMIARRNFTQRAKWKSAMQSLNHAGVRVIGSVITEH